MAKIIINGRFLLHRVTGVERYAKELLLELDKISRFGEFELAVPPETMDLPQYNSIVVKKVGRLHNRLWEHISFPYYVKKNKGLPLNLCNVAPLPFPGIVCIHDVKIKARPKDFSFLFRIWYNILFLNEISRACAIITVSNFSKKEIIKYYNVDVKRITIIEDSCQHFDRIKCDENALEKYCLKGKDFFFSLSSLEPNKNFKWIAEIARRMPDMLFIVGGSINSSIFREGVGYDCPTNMRLLGYVSDEEAKMLMNNCKAFIFPTFYEGFGIPPLEAINAGCKAIIVSDTDTMHEMFGNEANYIDPLDYEWKYDSNNLIEIKNKKKILEKYSWSKSAEKLYLLLKSI